MRIINHHPVAQSGSPCERPWWTCLLSRPQVLVLYQGWGTEVTLGFALLGGGVEGSLWKLQAGEHSQAALSRVLLEKRRGSPG